MLFNAIDDDELNIAYVYTCIHTLTYPNKDCFPTSLDGETQLNLLHYQIRVVPLRQVPVLDQECPFMLGQMPM